MSDNVDGMIRGLRDSGTTWAIQTAEELERLRRIEEAARAFYEVVRRGSVWYGADDDALRDALESEPQSGSDVK